MMRLDELKYKGTLPITMTVDDLIKMVGFEKAMEYLKLYDNKTYCLCLEKLAESENHPDGSVNTPLN